MTSDGSSESTAREELARLAARAMFEDPSLDVDGALRRVYRIRSGVFADVRTGRSLVHRHLQGMLEEAMGQEAFEVGRRLRLQSIIEVLDLVDYVLKPDAIDVAGRTARGFLEGPVLVFARVYAGLPLVELAEVLESSGVEEVVLATAHTRLGRLPSMHFTSDGIRFTLVGCTRAHHAERECNLYSGAPIAVASLEELHARTSIEE